MKQIKLTIAALLMASVSFAQTIPNAGFETWDNMGMYSNPAGWGTMNNTTALASIYTAEVGTPGNVGSSFLKLTSKTTPLGVANGIAVSGKLDSTTQMPVSGFAYTNRPVNMKGMWQHMIFGNSQGAITVSFTKWNTVTNMRDIIGSGSVTLSGMDMSWTAFTIPITFTAPSNPDSCMIVMKASGSTPTNNDYLWVDNLSFTVTPASISESVLTDVKIYPNPSSSVWNIKAQNTSQHIVAKLVNELGDELPIAKPTINNETFSLSISNENLPTGIYFLILHDGANKQTIQLVKK